MAPLPDTAGLESRLASEGASNDVGVAFVTYVHQLQYDLREARRREGFIFARVEELERKQRSAQQAAEDTLAHLRHLEFKVDQLENILSRTLRHVHPDPPRAQNLHPVNHTNVQTKIVSPDSNCWLEQPIESVTPARGSSIRRADKAVPPIYSSSPERLRSSGLGIDPNAKATSDDPVDTNKTVAGHRSTSAAHQNTAGGARQAAIKQNHGKQNKNTASVPIDAYSLGDSCDAWENDDPRKSVGLGIDGEKRNGIDAEDIETRGRAARGRTQDPEESTLNVTYEPVTATKLKRRKRSSSRRLSASDSPKAFDCRLPDLSKNLAQASENLKGNATELDGPAEAPSRNKRGTTDEPHHEPHEGPGDGRRKPMGPQDAVAEVRTVGDAVQMARSIWRRQAHDEYGVLERVAGRAHDDRVVPCPDCVPRFHQVTNVEDRNDKEQLNLWLRRHCKHQHLLKNKRETPDGYWDNSFNDTETQPPE